jgi:hypothetical protein
MGYDATNQTDLLVLNSEVNDDPISMGYVPDGPTQDILDLLNIPANNVGGETTPREFSVQAMLDALDPTEYGAPGTSVGAAQYVGTLSTTQGIDVAAYKTKFRDMFESSSATVTALDAQVTALSRAEVLFGVGTVITEEDWYAARDAT